ncbi:unnamed protein product [Prunus armeniaca]|uniref:DUF4219 domain-containing protein n=1 Tax=Prunus armeniaca TaxID=36596 RepID=A0A6J5VY41_PRUAR|nr:unnamed protein product [Prunus armeniaca]
MERQYGSSSHPPQFNGENYGEWKARIQAYIWAQGDDVWDLVLEGYAAPTKTERTIEKRKIETKDGVEEKDVVVSEFQIPKPKIEWTAEEKAMSVYNQKGIHAIFVAISSEQFAHIRNCKTSKEVWDNLIIVQGE